MIVKSITNADSEEGRGTGKYPDVSVLSPLDTLGREVISSLVLTGSVEVQLNKVACPDCHFHLPLPLDHISEACLKDLPSISVDVLER